MDAQFTRWMLPTLAATLLAGATVIAAPPQGPPCSPGPCGGPGMRGAMRGDDHAADMALFHQLLDNGAKIRRQVTQRPDGVESLTESDDPAIAKAIQAHVESMSARVEQARPIHQRDPLFREVFAHARQIVMTRELTGKGVKVVETSADPYVAKLIKAHAEVVTAFIANGRPEAMKNHPVPPR